MDKVYITGHRNPDTDSIVSAMAYAALKNALGQRQYWGTAIEPASVREQSTVKALLFHIISSFFLHIKALVFFL